MSTVTTGLDNILSGGKDWLTFESGKPVELLLLDWYEDLKGIREHYEASLNPRYVRCPGKDICPLCAANPGKYPALRIKLRAFDPKEKKIKFISLAKTHIKSIHKDLTLDELDPTQTVIRIIRDGSGATDTSYSARASKSEFGEIKFSREDEMVYFDGEEFEVPDLDSELTAHTPDEIRGFMNALTAGAGEASQVTGAEASAPAAAPGKKLPF